ncbi:hypothetical protein GGX14DRAFT_406498 [Mycena pura]|uniref:Uncharacterized protein n=1 Tax=Mycena pura TaxID=153505 RepID=A0AAD6XZL7_9AGAR|nr:hypothetical protein GGX14DRAFT_406498 [Mycena pura]
MPKGRAIRICNCALRPTSHKVQDENAHRLELEAFLRTQNAILTEAVARLAVSDPSAALPNPSQPLPPAHIILSETEKSMRAVLSEAASSDVKQPSREAQNTRILESLSFKIQAAMTSLRSANRASVDTNALWETVDRAKRELEIVASSLRPLKETPESAKVEDEMRKLECELNDFTVAIPKDKRPLYYDSGMCSYAFCIYRKY